MPFRKSALSAPIFSSIGKVKSESGVSSLTEDSEGIAALIAEQVNKLLGVNILASDGTEIVPTGDAASSYRNRILAVLERKLETLRGEIDFFLDAVLEETVPGWRDGQTFSGGRIGQVKMAWVSQFGIHGDNVSVLNSLAPNNGESLGDYKKRIPSVLEEYLSWED